MTTNKCAKIDPYAFLENYTEGQKVSEEMKNELLELYYSNTLKGGLLDVLMKLLLFFGLL